MLEAVGPIYRQARRDLPLPESLCRAVAGQQLSVVAADTIWSRFEAFRGRRDLVPFLARVTDAFEVTEVEVYAVQPARVEPPPVRAGPPPTPPSPPS